MNLSKLREDRTLAHVVPMIFFMVVGGVLSLAMGLMFQKHALDPWWKSDPEQWIYPVQTLATLAVLGFWWRQYELKWSTGKVLFGALMGVVGIGFMALADAVLRVAVFGGGADRIAEMVGGDAAAGGV